MPRGRKPKPSALNARRGNPGHRKVNEDEPKPSTDPVSLGKPPSFLNRDAKEEWKRIAPELVILGLLTIVDRSALAGYCAAYSRWVKAERELQKSEKDGGGFIYKTPSGYKQQSPFIAIAKGAMETMHKFSIEFGFTPAARTRIKGSGKTNDADDDYFNNDSKKKKGAHESLQH